MNKRVLFVDDEVNVLEGLRRNLRSKKNDWDISFVPSGGEALKLMQTLPFDIIVTDMRMPEMDGAELLERVMRKHPDTVRFILSGQSDQNTILRSIRCAHQFLSKPCDLEILVNSISRALALRELLHNDKLKRFVTEIRVIPSLPKLYFEVLEELQSSNCSIAKIGEIIEKDIGMSAKVLQLVNSAFFGLANRVASPVQASIYLGTDVIKSLVLVAHVFSSMDLSKVPDLSLEKLQNHSVFTAWATRALVKKEMADDKVVEDSFIAGLFHDIGKLVLAANLPEQYRKVLQLQREKNITGIIAEKQVLGSSHAEIGAYLLGLWGFADSIIEASAYHHSPGLCSEQTFSVLTAVHVANAFYYEWTPEEIGSSAEVLDFSHLSRLGLENSLAGWRDICKEIYVRGKNPSQNDQACLGR
jgi:HD-like signal output (HDOD) protein/CheY-like chemotaxis protein